MIKKLSICIPSSCGGHLREVLMLEKSYYNHNITYILNDKINNKKFMSNNNIYFITHIENYLFLFINFIQIYFILKKIKPNIIISTGASPAVITSLIAKYLFQSKIIFIESITRIKKPSKTGKLMYRISDTFIYRHKELKKFFPKGMLFEL